MSSREKVFLGSDHAGLPLKRILLPRLREAFPDIDFEDLGTDSEHSVDYPPYAASVGKHAVENHARGLLFCGSGIGMCIAANKVHGVRAAQVWDATSARLSRQHNDANVLCMGARLTGPEVAFEACRVWLGTAFEGGRHQGRVDLITALEGKGN